MYTQLNDESMHGAMQSFPPFWQHKPSYEPTQLTIWPELKLQEFVPKLALVANIVPHIEIHLLWLASYSTDGRHARSCDKHVTSEQRFGAH